MSQLLAISSFYLRTAKHMAQYWSWSRREPQFGEAARRNLAPHHFLAWTPCCCKDPSRQHDRVVLKGVPSLASFYPGFYYPLCGSLQPIRASCGGSGVAGLVIIHNDPAESIRLRTIPVHFRLARANVKLSGNTKFNPRLFPWSIPNEASRRRLVGLGKRKRGKVRRRCLLTLC